MIGVLDTLSRMLQADYYRAAKLMTSMDSIMSYHSSEIGNMLSAD